MFLTTDEEEALAEMFAFGLTAVEIALHTSISEKKIKIFLKKRAKEGD